MEFKILPWLIRALILNVLLSNSVELVARARSLTRNIRAEKNKSINETDKNSNDDVKHMATGKTAVTSDIKIAAQHPSKETSKEITQKDLTKVTVTNNKILGNGNGNIILTQNKAEGKAQAQKKAEGKAQAGKEEKKSDGDDKSKENGVSVVLSNVNIQGSNSGNIGTVVLSNVNIQAETKPKPEFDKAKSKIEFDKKKPEMEFDKKKPEIEIDKTKSKIEFEDKYYQTRPEDYGIGNIAKYKTKPEIEFEDKYYQTRPEDYGIGNIAKYRKHDTSHGSGSGNIGLGNIAKSRDKKRYKFRNVILSNVNILGSDSGNIGLGNQHGNIHGVELFNLSIAGNDVANIGNNNENVRIDKVHMSNLDVIGPHNFNIGNNNRNVSLGNVDFSNIHYEGTGYGNIANGYENFDHYLGTYHDNVDLYHDPFTPEQLETDMLVLLPHIRKILVKCWRYNIRWCDALFRIKENGQLQLYHSMWSNLKSKASRARKYRKDPLTTEELGMYMYELLPHIHDILIYCWRSNNNLCDISFRLKVSHDKVIVAGVARGRKQEIVMPVKTWKLYPPP